eukprot:1722407-Alexandrium_andersonii.AAC.1
MLVLVTRPAWMVTPSGPSCPRPSVAAQGPRPRRRRRLLRRWSPTPSQASARAAFAGSQASFTAAEKATAAGTASALP